MMLRYNISSWDQLSQCQSNNSTDLYITTSHIVQDSRLTGTVIKVNHRQFGTLFAYLVEGSGPLLSEDSTNHFFELTTLQILSELEKFGFVVTYNPRKHLDGDQLDYLMTLDKLNFDKIRILNVYQTHSDGSTAYTPTVVAFRVKENPDWINSGYSAPYREFITALDNGSAINVSKMSQDLNFRWDWLDYVASIHDILRDNQ